MESTNQSECLVIANADANIWLNGQKILSDVKIRNECGFVGHTRKNIISTYINGCQEFFP